MSGRCYEIETLINAALRQMMFLTLTIVILCGATFSHADTLPSSADIEADKVRAGEVANYWRKQLFHGMSVLPSDMRDMMGWFSGNWHPMKLSDDDEVPLGPHGLPMALDDQPPQESSAWPVTFGSNFHHKGFLPTHDTLMMGMGIKNSFYDDKIGITARPFYGQSWHSLHSYQGAEMALDVVQRPDGMPWGKLALGYVRGNDSLTDHGQGMEMHGDIDLTSGFKLTSGIHQDNIAGSNYMMLRWKLDFQ